MENNIGTRAIIKVEGKTSVAVYKHFDGYPEATLDWLKVFNKDFAENREDDPDYKFAQLLRNSVRSEKEFGLDSSEYTGWGVVDLDENGNVDGWQQYEYTLKTDGSVEWIEV